MVVFSGILVAKPAVIEQEEIDAQVLCLAKERDELLLIKIEIGVLPVVEQSHAVVLCLVELVAHHPSLEPATAFAYPVCGKGEEEIRCTEGFSLPKQIGGRIVVDAAHDAQDVLVVHFEGEAEVARPSERSHQNTSLVLANRSTQTDLEEGLRHHVGTSTQAAIDHLLAELQLLVLHLHLLCPVASKLCEVILGSLEIEHRRGIAAQINLALFLLLYLCPLLDDVLLGEYHPLARLPLSPHPFGWDDRR